MIKKTNKYNKKFISSELIRWIHYDPLLTRLFFGFNPVSLIPLLYKLKKEFVPIVWGGHGKPLAETQRNSAQLLYTAARGYQFGMNKLLPLGVILLVGTDVVYYFKNPELRFGTTIGTILSGFATNEKSISTRLFSNFPHERRSYWLGPGLMIGLPLLTLLGSVAFKGLQSCFVISETAETISKDSESSIELTNLGRACSPFALIAATNAIIWSNIHSETQKEKILTKMLSMSKKSLLALWHLRQVIDSLAKQRSQHNFSINKKEVELEDENIPLIDENNKLLSLALDGLLDVRNHQATSTARALYIDYLMYSIGYFPKNRKGTLGILVFLGVLSTIINLYSRYRFYLTIIRKILEYKDFLIQGGTCEKNGLQFTMRDFEYICGVCPEWPFVPKSETTTAQGCLDYLLKQARDPADLIKLMKKLFQSSSNSTEAAPQNNDTHIDNVDVSERDWIKWSDQMFETFLDTLEQQKQYEQLNFSRPTEGNVWDDYDKLELLTVFLDKVAVKKLDLARLALGKGTKIIAKSLINQTDIENIDLNSNDIDDDAVDDIAPLFARPEVTDINLGKNSISNDGLEKILPFADKSNVKKLDLSRNNLGVQEGLDILAKLISQFKQLNWLNIGGQSFNGLDFTAFGNALLNSNVKSLNLYGASLGTFDFYSLSPYFNRLTHLNLGNNGLDSRSLGYIMKGLSNGSLIELNVANNQLDDNALTVLANGLKSIATITRLNLADNAFGRDGLKTVLNAINGPVDYLDLSNNSQNNAIDALIEWLNETTNVQIGELVLSNNQMPDSQGAALIKACSKHSINVLKLDHNILGSQTAQAINDSLSNDWNVTTLDLSNNHFNATDVKHINSALNVSEVIDLKFSGNSINHTETFIEFSVTFRQ